ncbi:hypothetical protein Mterra_01692 [Calidithermus terrae]|uniref:Microbial-type PARG catalytic domain-containing protein n=1 Tax=Calidithermus terrae TaxID=1408545 RepID=A0A399EL57_9DEIN|nr:TIGR02452 family protein [Calidithermus terrae]RIH85454.1 hypothetical protein Mterra_01692 [Calidithermus terrae]
MARNRRAEIAAETVRILEQGFYQAPSGKRVELEAAMRYCTNNTQLYTPDALDPLLQDLQTRPRRRFPQTRVEVTNESSLEAARRMVAASDEPVICLNFASAKNPGGGFLGGAQAQEESLARSSGLYFSLLTQPHFYEFHRKQGDLLYSDHMIYSPKVPVFRTDEGTLLEEPYLLSFITSPAPNAGALAKNQPARLGAVLEVLKVRSEKILALAVRLGYTRIILGAWGCGVFKNSPEEVAWAFHSHLAVGGLFNDRFQEVAFAILDKSEAGATYAAFAHWFAS